MNTKSYCANGKSKFQADKKEIAELIDSEIERMLNTPGLDRIGK
jgi:hypothetical protein